jgi:hypothetical protein
MVHKIALKWDLGFWTSYFYEYGNNIEIKYCASSCKVELDSRLVKSVSYVVTWLVT